MKPHILLAAAIVAVLFFASCRDAKYPIDAVPSVKMDQRLVGTWKAKEKKGNKLVTDNDVLYMMHKQNDYEYMVILKTNKKKETETTTAYLSDVNKALFLNVYVKGDTAGYSFFRILDIDAKGNKVTVASIADTTMNALTSSAQVRERITKNLNNPLFYKDTVYLIRAK
jgi:hypothetical protein